jgi:DNA-directed RNA polymerase subunit RPC12/RpoP
MTVDSHAPDAGETPPKTVLFCPDCSHRSRIGGEWCVLTTNAGRYVFCPACGRLLTARPLGSAGASVPSVRKSS